MAIDPRFGFCTIHRIGYRVDLDPVCPQCTLARMSPFKPDSTSTQLRFDPQAQKPVDIAGKLLDPITLVPVV
jgi:hypothetical protein